jgi:adenylate cyclase
MRLLMYIILLLTSFKGVAQNFSSEEQHQIDSLNQVIANPNSPDTSLAGSCVALSEILYVSNIDTLKSLCEKAKFIAEKALKANPIGQTKKSLLTHLGGALNNIGYVYGQQGDISKALEYYHKSLKIQEEIGCKVGIATSFNNIGFIYQNQGDFPKALEYFHKSLKIDEEIGNKKGIASVLNNIGLIFYNLGDIPKALEYWHKSLKIQEEIVNKKGIAASLNNIGAIYKDQDDLPKALEYFHKSLKIDEEIGNKGGKASRLNNIGLIYYDQGDLTKALEYYHKSLKIQEEIGDKEGVARSLNNIGLIYYDQGDLPKALEYYHKSLKIQEEIGYQKGIARSFHNIGGVEFQKGNTSGIAAAKQYFLKSLEIALELGSPELISGASGLLSKTYEKQGKGMLALEMHKLHIQMRDSIKNEATLKASIQQETKYAYEKVQAVKDAEHDKQLAIEKEAKAKQQVITYATGGGLGLVAIFLLFVMNRLKVTRKQKVIIEEQKQESEKLLLNILPAEIASELKVKGYADAQLIQHVTVLFTDFKGFTALSEILSPQDLVSEINVCFSAFDHIMGKHNIEKIKTIGDAYMAAGGLPTANDTHAIDVVRAALEIQEFMLDLAEKKKAKNEPFFEIRIGVHTGPVVAGIVGVKKFQYDIWGDTVNTASRMESSGGVGKVNISELTYEIVKNRNEYTFENRGKIEAKGKGLLEMFFVEKVKL